MKLLYLITGLRLGGAEKQLLLISERMKLAGYNVLVVSMETGGALANEFRKKGIDIIELDITGIKDFFSGYWKLKAVVKNYKPDIIHTHLIHANLFGRFFKLFSRGFKLICTAHNIREGNPLMMRAYTFTNLIADWSTNVSQEAYNFFIQKKYFSLRLSSCIPNAIDTEVFNKRNAKQTGMREELGIPQTSFVFLAAGRLEPQKNFQLLLPAFLLVKREVKDAVLVIAGEGPLNGLLSKLSNQLGIVQSVILAGRRDDMPDLMAMCNCFVLSSDFEGFGLVVAEAMAMEKPVIATDCGGVREVMGGTGILVARNDIEALAAAMIARYHAKWPAFSLASGRKHIETHYSVGVISDQWRNLYSNI
jgi:glycosyltransferase involved in cell wall biosynthesis